MEPLFYVIAIMGCGDSAVACQEARVEPVRYESAAQCQAAMLPALERNADLSFPVITAACQSRNQFMARADKASPAG
ncbi:hypothetical protein [Sphingomonas baiyangensis]|uniref:Uncharacterized protein n=1 Tax=Sphingomonas baiyangensis TaxID=2572576 RepID=A0A4U1L4X2_9SPHN|nr:hypothetical protein [Sphingomonas baiyangensis]TKD51323.1 hypothetical protein FBR43_11595 [Sphingomonas baiyangensis]